MNIRSYLRKASIPLALLVALALPLPAWGVNHLIVISEVYSNEDGTVQYVELYTDFAGQTDLAPTKLVGLNEDGTTSTTIFDFTATFLALGAGETILLATADFDDVYGFSPDFIIPDSSVPMGSGRVVFQHTSPCPGITDCEIYAVAYGDFSGDNNRFGDPAAALPSDGCKSLTMIDQTDESADDYEADFGTPEKNSGTSTTLSCPEKLPLSMTIGEVFSNEDGSLQFVELVAGADNETLLEPVAVLSQNADGTAETTVFDFTKSFADLAAGESILLATKGFSTEFGFTPDFVIADGSLSLGNGRVWLEVDSANCDTLPECEIDALAYGSFSGNNNVFGDPAAELPADGCTGLTRNSDTDDNATDFATATVSPTRNDGASGTTECPSPFVQFVRADVNSDGAVGLSDGIGLLNFMFLGGTVTCKEAGDVNNSGSFTLADPLALLGYLFLMGTAPSSPFPGCGEDNNYSLGCDAFDECP